MPDVLLTRRIPSAVLSRLHAACTVDLWDGPAAISHDELKRRVAGKDALICVLTDRIDREVIDAGSRLKIVANIAVGYDNIDVAAARARGIVVTNTPDVLTGAVAEFTWGLILAAARRIPEGDRLVRRREWRGWALDFMLGMELKGKQLGIIGRGRIGRAVAEIAPAFGMTVMFAPRGKRAPEGSAEGAASAQRGGESKGAPPSEVRMDELLVTSDVVSIHAPLTPATRHLIDRKALARMKRSAILVNTARGPIVDEEALAWALRERLIAAAALDVYESEPAIRDELLGMDNVVLAPHLGSATRETRTAMADFAVRNVLGVLEGQPPLTPV